MGRGANGKGGESAAASARPLSKWCCFLGKHALRNEGVEQADAGLGRVLGVTNVHGATGKTVNAISRMVNAAMPAIPMRAQIYLTTGFSWK